MCVFLGGAKVLSDCDCWGVTITGSPSQQHSGPASPALLPEPSCSLLRQAAAPSGTFSLPPAAGPTLTQLQPCPSPPPNLPQEELSQSPGRWSSSGAEGSLPALPLGVISPTGMPLQPGLGQGQGGASSEESLPVLTSAFLGLSASWSHPGSAQVVQGAGGRKLRGRGTRLVQVLGPTALSFSQSNDWMHPGSPDLGGCPLPTLHSRSSLGLTHAPAAAPSCAPLLWGLSFRVTSFPCCQDGHSDEDAMLIHPLWPSWG